MNNSLEREFEDQVFTRQQQLIEERRKRMLDRVMRRLAAQGQSILESGIGSDVLQREVEEPIAQAEAGLDWMRLQQMEKRRAELEAERQRKSAFWGRLAGGVLQGGISGFVTGGPWGALAGAGIGAAGGIMSGGGETQTTGGGGYNSMYMQAFQEWLEKLDQKQASFPPYMGY